LRGALVLREKDLLERRLSRNYVLFPVFFNPMKSRFAFRLGILNIMRYIQHLAAFEISLSRYSHGWRLSSSDLMD
jgi:hypothetical protein